MPTGKRGRPSTAPAADEGAGPGPGSTASGIVALHRSRMFEWKPLAVVAIAPCPGAPLFAVGYESGSLELWDMLQLVCIQTVVGPSLEITSLAWARDSVTNTWRTFAAFLDGTVAEVLWRQAAVAHSSDSYGGVVWALAASPVSVVKPGFSHTLAAACDDGSVRLFGCEGGEPGLVPERVLARLEGRLLCAAWHAGGTALAVAGSSGNIHVLDAVTGRERLRITAAASTARPVTVWRLLFLPDGTLVSGDSDGAVQMWDSRFGTLLHRFTQHRADVLAMAATGDGATVFAAGVDSQVAMFCRTGGGGGAAASAQPEAWVYTHYKRPHTHDVRALALLTLPDGGGKGSILLSGGVDAQLMAYPAKTFLQEHPHRLCKVPQRPMCHVAVPPPPPLAEAAPTLPRLLVAQNDTLDVWQLAAAAAPPAASRRDADKCAVAEGEPLELMAAPRHLAQIRTKGARIASASLSPSGVLLACTTPAGTRAYRLTAAAAAAAAAAPAALTRLKLPPAAAVPAVAVAVTDSHLVLAMRDGGLMSCNLGDGAAAVTARRSGTATARPQAAAAADAKQQQAWRGYCPAAAQLVVSPEGSLLAAVGGQGISLYRLPDLEPLGRPLQADGAFTTVAFSCDGRLVAATTSDCHLLVWETSSPAAAGADVSQVRWCLDNAEAITAAIARLPGTPTGISFCPTAAAAVTAHGGDAVLPYRLIVSSPGGMVHLDLSRRVSEFYLQWEKGGAAGAGGRRVRGPLRPEQREQPEDRPESRFSNGRVIRTVHPAVWVGHVGASDLLLMEKPWEEVLGALPPPLLTQRYGSG
ncbi:hypothetical protein PLESTB_001544800 [Pleodorina starrii]|uniref:Uncharacterized protein n=1 Tax=Pleodorina starrii TaxID=330485 RepID=A0A9W6BXW4_9CHLO|nr:hypothetical protein PLESTM_001998400 [Pleodorina starrii]GLC59870.1 hypothetical protein PLESTB_001544800 [Pleodorina starrii]GLC69092.1 hypothetical protein PLESTF_000788200 [Pleodorina starrii]